MHPLYFVHIPATASYYKYLFFPLAIVSGIDFPNISLSSQTQILLGLR